MLVQAAGSVAGSSSRSQRNLTHSRRSTTLESITASSQVSDHAASERRWVVLAFAAAVLPAFVDYQWAGVGFVLLTWLWFRGGSHLYGLLAFIGRARSTATCGPS